MKKVWTDSGEEAKLVEQKHKEMNELVGLNNIPISKNITLLINDWCKEQIKTLHKEYPNTEWLAYCKVIPKWNGVFLMTDMVHPWQKATGWDVETTKEWMEWLTRELINRKEKLTEWNCVLHSHHHMGVFRSGTDDNARLGLNDWRKLARAVVTAYSDKGIDYKGCINFYKPYNIEIDIDVRDENETTVIDRFNEFKEMVLKKRADYYDSLLEANKELIDNLTDEPDYSVITSYLWIDILDELKQNYDIVKEKIWNPELLDYLKQLENQAEELAENEINVGWKYNDMLIEYGAFCNWSDNLLTQLEENKKQQTYVSSINSISNTPSLFSSTATPSNRDFEDDYYSDYYFNCYEYDEYYVRQCLWIGADIPMRAWAEWEWLAWSNTHWRFIYVEDWADEYYD